MVGVIVVWLALGLSGTGESGDPDIMSQIENGTQCGNCAVKHSD